jgi:hypothetical protein
MGLSISVGILDDRSGFDRLTEALADEGIDWHEPEIADPPAGPVFSAGFSYSYLTHLRRVFVLADHGELLTCARDTEAGQYARDREKILDDASMLSSHLLCHADDSGYYIPVDFDDPLFFEPEAGVEGYGMVGSSQRLLAELAHVAPALGIHLDADGTLSAAQESALTSMEEDAPFEMEKFTWHQLHRACRASIASGRAIVFY